jgi:hypothetical protein
MILHDTKSNSQRVYNEQYGNIELDSVFSDLFTDYLNYFLPLSERDVNFPTFVDTLSQMNQAHMTTTNPIILPSHRHHHHQQQTSLFKRKIQKLITNTNTNSAEDLASMLGETDRLGDMKKIDLFLRLINELLIYPFTDMSTRPITQPMQSLKLTPNKNFTTNPTQTTSLSSPLKYDDPTQYLANLEIVFALSMILKHSHLFCNAFTINFSYQSTNKILESKSDINLNQFNKLNRQNNNSNNNVEKINSNNQYECPTDEFRVMLFKNYWRKSFYKFLQFHFIHWPMTPSLKWIIELWFTYIQPWKFVTAIPSESQSANIVTEFIKENFLNYVDIYQLIVKRYCIVDFTIEDNLQVLHQILDVSFLLLIIQKGVRIYPQHRTVA